MPEEDNNATAPTDELKCTRMSIGERIERLELNVTNLEQTIVKRIKQETDLQDKNREIMVAQLTGELKNIENAMRGHIGDQRADEERHHDNLTRLHERLDKLMSRTERNYNEEFKAVHRRIDQIKDEEIPRLYTAMGEYAKNFNEALRPILKISYMRLGFTAGASSILTLLLYFALSIARGWIKQTYGF